MPRPVHNLEGVNITKVACGDSVSMALSDTGELYCWGTFRVSSSSSYIY